MVACSNARHDDLKELHKFSPDLEHRNIETDETFAKREKKRALTLVPPETPCFVLKRSFEV
jgi:hypothetical protein